MIELFYLFFMIASIEPEEEILLKQQPDHEHVILLLSSYTANWDRLGGALGISFAQRQDIRLDGTIPKNLDKLNAVVNEWITQQTSEVTWEHFIKAMKSISLNQLAGNIKAFLEKEDIKKFYADKRQ